jgi:hypothetical protein
MKPNNFINSQPFNIMNQPIRPCDVYIWRSHFDPATNKRTTSREFLYSARFHGFFHEGDSGEMTVVAVVENESGQCDTVAANCITFTDVIPKLS